MIQWLRRKLRRDWIVTRYSRGLPVEVVSRHRTCGAALHRAKLLGADTHGVSRHA